ncbi:MAG: transcriptional antiterminator RfaH [Paraglaciecola sp.]|jgi:transcriptional antiterminator RfaH
MAKERAKSENHLHDTEPRWFAVYTNYKREKLVEKMLKQKQIDCYLPIQKVTRKYVRKVRTLELPLISCYIFVKIIKKEYVPVLETEYVLKFTKIAQNLLSIPEAEMETMKRVVGEGVDVSIEPTAMQNGDEVEIISGNLTGLKGKLISIEGKKEVVVELEQMGYSLRMNVDASLLRSL